MTTVTATSFHRNIGMFMDQARIEPVQITQHRRPKAVLISPELYEQLLQGVNLKAVRTKDLPENMLQTISKPLSQEEFDAGGIQLTDY